MRLARRQNRYPGNVLGKVFAHELGHLLLPGQGHTSEGVMSAAPNMSARTLTFTSAQNASIHALLAREQGMRVAEDSRRQRRSEFSVLGLSPNMETTRDAAGL